jgi:hypothetical protein
LRLTLPAFCVLLCGMFVREKPIGPYRYVYLVESVREGGRTKQRIFKNLGRKEQVELKGDCRKWVGEQCS